MPNIDKHTAPFKVEVASSSMVMELMARGARNRHVAETNMNERSSRSHQECVWGGGVIITYID